MDYKSEELLICVIARLLDGVDHIAVGVSSPIPGSASLLRQKISESPVQVTVLNSKNLQQLNDGAGELFDCAAQGRIGAFFLSGGQIDGRGNINLVGVGDYPQMNVRWSGSFGSAFLYYLVPKVILFREEHTRRTLVDSVDFISAAGTSEPGTYRRGGPYALVTNLAQFSFDKGRGGFRLESIHPGHTLEEILDNTGFEFEYDPVPETTLPPSSEWLSLLRNEVSSAISDPYPKFAHRVFNIPVNSLQ